MDDDLLKELPLGMALSWGLVKEPQRGPKREMNLARIVEAAIELADRDGLAAVSMNRVAASLGFTAMSLYRYIPSKEDLLLLMQDAVCDISLLSEFDEADWRENIREYVRKCVSVFREHPWFGDIPISGIPVTPNNLKIIDWVLGAMRPLPVTDSEKMAFLLLLSSYARAFGMVRRDMDRAMKAGVTPEEFSGVPLSAALKQLVRQEQFPALHPIVMSGAYTGEGLDVNEAINDFDFGLERILDGMEQYVNSKQKQNSGRSS